MQTVVQTDDEFSYLLDDEIVDGQSGRRVLRRRLHRVHRCFPVDVSFFSNAVFPDALFSDPIFFRMRFFSNAFFFGCVFVTPLFFVTLWLFAVVVFCSRLFSHATRLAKMESF